MVYKLGSSKPGIHGGIIFVVPVAWILASTYRLVTFQRAHRATKLLLGKLEGNSRNSSLQYSIVSLTSGVVSVNRTKDRGGTWRGKLIMLFALILSVLG